MSNNLKEFHLWIPLLLMGINVISVGFMVEELIDASPPNYGAPLLFLTPIFGLISLSYISHYATKKNTLLIWLLQGLNCFFTIFPLIVLIIFTLIMI
ncbi:hypothetical protein [Lentibacillus cibarius]|uniref:Uncharacterized protein n=1 Tax=Lentibacillus cibarius TaxID=2583219 RepID=A0A5S3QJP2_9BACI|nr:hypothetical protein [Lentibacillus cibarius]TMN18795.1 hypothetical protein FFL34_17730 [Lentibacillus cibarius]TMN18823.1 hypothetical protein FFL34_17895 [Lentibacillus cibarius]